MPYESVACPKCGSSDSQEVKPGTHFCNYCDNVFRFIPPTAQSGGVAACATCGVIAAGLCGTCGRHFCRNHQAVEANNKRLTGWCADCLSEQSAVREAQSRKSGRIYLEESARSELAAARIPLVTLWHVGLQVTTRFGQRRVVKDHNWGMVGTGWLLGDFNWIPTSAAGGPFQTVFYAECPGPAKLHAPAGLFAASTHQETKSVLFGRVTAEISEGRYVAAIRPGALKASYEQLAGTVQRIAGTTEQHT